MRIHDNLSFGLSFVILGMGIICIIFPIPSIKYLEIIASYNMLGVLGFILTGVTNLIGITRASKIRIIFAYILGIISWCLLVDLNILSINICHNSIIMRPTTSNFIYRIHFYNAGIINAIITICISTSALIPGTIIFRRYFKLALK